MAAVQAAAPLLSTQKVNLRYRRVTLINAGAAAAAVNYKLRDDSSPLQISLTSGAAWEISGEEIEWVMLDPSTSTATVQFHSGWIFRSLAAGAGPSGAFTPSFLDVQVILQPTVLTEQTVFVVPAGQAFEFIGYLFTNATGVNQTVTDRNYEETATTVIFSAAPNLLANSSGQLNQGMSASFGRFNQAGQKVSAQLSGTLGATGALRAWYRRIA